MDALKVCFVTSELHPFSKTGGLADVSAALTRDLHGRGHDVRTFTPLYGRIDRSRMALAPIQSIRDVPVGLGGRTYTFSVLRGSLPAPEVPVYFVDCPELYDRKELYTSDPDEHIRFAMLSRAVIESAQRMQWAPDVFHCHDWHAALTPLYLKTLYAWDALFRSCRTVLTIHNIGYQGIFTSDILSDLALADSAHLFDNGDMQAGQINFLRTGLLWADMITTVSRTYAREIQTEEYGAGLHALLRSRSDVLTGIVNGADYEEWDPAKDTHIPFRYSAKSLTAKGKNRKALLERMKLPIKQGVPVLGIVSRLTGQKGFDLFEEVLPGLLASHEFRLAVLGTGEEEIERVFVALRKKNPDRIGFHKGFSNELAHLIEAGSDMFVMPSRYEPCGLNQMYSMKYGTVPIVRRTGGLADTVTPFDPETGEGTGFVFDEYTTEALRAELDRAFEVWKNRKAWKQLMLNGMAQDFSWSVRGGQYVEIYSRLAGRTADRGEMAGVTA